LLTSKNFETGEASNSKESTQKKLEEIVLDLRNLQENFDVTADATKCTKIKQSHLPLYKAALAHTTHDRSQNKNYIFERIFSGGLRWVNRTHVLFAAKLGVMSVDT